MTKYRKKPIVIDADVYKIGMEDGFMTIGEAIISGLKKESYIHPKSAMFKGIPYIKTLEGYHFISEGDFIIIGVKGERYPIKEPIFKETYEKV